MEEVEPMTPLKERLFETLRLKLKSYDFELNLKRHRFNRRRDGVTDVFLLACLDAPPGYRVVPDVGVRLERVENIFHQTSGFKKKEDQLNTMTWGLPVSYLLGGPTAECEFLLQEPAQVEGVAEQIFAVFREWALPFYERWGSLKAIDKAVNENPEERVLFRSLAWFRCSTGLITARLTGRPDYDRLLQIYTDIMKKDNKGFYYKWFAALVESLDKVPAGSGLTG